MILIKVPAATLYSHSFRLEHAAKMLEKDAGRILAEKMVDWAYEFLDRMKTMAMTGSIPWGADPPSEWTKAINEGDTYSYQSGKFWDSMEVKSRWLAYWAEVTITPTGDAAHSSRKPFPMAHLMVGLGHTTGDREMYEIEIKDPKSIQKVMGWLHYHYGDKVPPAKKKEPGTDKTKEEKAVAIRVPRRPLLAPEIWEQEMAKLEFMLTKALKTAIDRVIGGPII